MDDEDYTAVISERGVAKALGTKRGGSHWKRQKADPGAEFLPVYLSAPNLRPFISPELENSIKNPIIYLAPNSGGKLGHGVPATVLPEICRVWTQAREARVLLKSQEHIAKIAEIIHHGFSKVGIIGMVYEATGFDKIKDRKVLEHYLSKFLSDHLLDWARTFPDEFYQQIFRLFHLNSNSLQYLCKCFLLT